MRWVRYCPEFRSSCNIIHIYSWFDFKLIWVPMFSYFSLFDLFHKKNSNGSFIVVKATSWGPDEKPFINRYHDHAINFQVNHTTNLILDCRLHWSPWVAWMYAFRCCASVNLITHDIQKPCTIAKLLSVIYTIIIHGY